MARILITGAAGFLGHNLLLGLRSGHELLAGYYRNLPGVAGCNPVPLDVSRASQVSEQIGRIMPDLVVHAAAIASPGYVESVLRQWRRGEPVTFYTDQYRTPAFAPQVAACIDKLLLHPEVRGILHLGGPERLSRFDFGVLLARQAGVAESLFRPGA